MDVIGLLPRLRLRRFPVGQVCLWTDRVTATRLDTGAVGSGRAIADTLTAPGPSPVWRIVPTAFPEDHADGAGEFAAPSGAEVPAHRPDAPAVFADREPPLRAEAVRHLPRGGPGRPGRVTDLSDGGVLDRGPDPGHRSPRRGPAADGPHALSPAERRPPGTARHRAHAPAAPTATARTVRAAAVRRPPAR